jgi:hypothetical protein
MTPLFHPEAEQLRTGIEAKLLALKATQDKETRAQLQKEIHHEAVQYKAKTGECFRRNFDGDYTQ